MTEPEFIAAMNKNAADCAEVANGQKRIAGPIIALCVASIANVGAFCYLSTRTNPAMYFLCGIAIGIILSIGVAVHLVARHRWKALMETRQHILNHKALVVSIGCLRQQEEDGE